MASPSRDLKGELRRSARTRPPSQALIASVQTSLDSFFPRRPRQRPIAEPRPDKQPRKRLREVSPEPARKRQGRAAVESRPRKLALTANCRKRATARVRGPKPKPPKPTPGRRHASSGPACAPPRSRADTKGTGRRKAELRSAAAPAAEITQAHTKRGRRLEAMGEWVSHCAACDLDIDLRQPGSGTVCDNCDEAYHWACVQRAQPSLAGRPAPTAADTWFCRNCPAMDCSPLLSRHRHGHGHPLTQGGRELLRAVMGGRTPAFQDGVLSEPFGCGGFVCLRGKIGPEDCAALLERVGSSPDRYPRASMLTPSINDHSRKVYCCGPEQRRLRGGRYGACLRESNTVPLVQHTLQNGETLNAMMEALFASPDPFCISNHLLCQQLGWHYEDLDPHCDKERPDKTCDKQQPGFDGVGDRITSLTLRRGCWLFMRETRTHSNSFAVHLEPGDVYTLAGDSRWKWQHAILLDEPPAGPLDCRVSIIFRILEEHPA